MLKICKDNNKVLRTVDYEISIEGCIMIGEYFKASLGCETGEIARMMFLKTADNNYIMARKAFFGNIILDFLWLSLHSIEKYLKATLLLNDKSAKYGHDIVRLYEEVRSLDERISFGPLVKPEKHSFD